MSNLFDFTDYKPALDQLVQGTRYKCFNTTKRGQNKTNPYEGLLGFLVQNKFNHDFVKHLMYSTKYDPNVAHKPIRSKPNMPRGFATCNCI